MCAKRGIVGAGSVGGGMVVGGARSRAWPTAPLCRPTACGASRCRVAPLVAAAITLLIGTAPAQPPAAAKPGNTAQPPAAKPGNTPNPPLAAVAHAGLMAAVARHKGKVVVLDCWSTSCPPCVKEFPRLVALQERYRDQVVCMSVSLDFEGLDPVDMLVPTVLRFLQEVKAGGVVNLIATEEADTMYKKLQLDSVPAVYVWKADGTLARRFDEGDAKTRLGRPFTYDDVEADVRGLLAK